MSRDPMKQISDALKGPDLPDGDGEEMCPVCDRKITVDPANGKEYGHRRGSRRGDGKDCPRRPKGVEPGMMKAEQQP